MRRDYKFQYDGLDLVLIHFCIFGVCKILIFENIENLQSKFLMLTAVLFFFINTMKNFDFRIIK